MMQERKIGIAAAVLLVALAAKGHAAIVVSNYAALPSTDGSSITTDTAMGLDWLDPSATIGLSYNDVFSLLGSDARYNGFRFATRLEINRFFSNLPIPLPTSLTYANVFIKDNGVSYTSASGFFGYTYPLDTVNIYTYGLTADSAEDPLGSAHFLMVAGRDSSFSFTAGNVVSRLDDEVDRTFGSWLVRDTPAPPPDVGVVPEPASLAIWGLGALGLAVAAYRRWKQPA